MCPVRSVTHVTERTDGLAPPGCARPRRQPLVRAAPGSNQESCCRTSRLATPRARGPVLAAGARKRHIHVMRLPPHAAVRPLPNRRHWRTRCLAPSPEGQWRRHAARPARRWGPVPARRGNVATRAQTEIHAEHSSNPACPAPADFQGLISAPRRSVPGGARRRRFQPSSSPHGTLPPSHPARPRRRLRPVHRHPAGPIGRALKPRP